MKIGALELRTCITSASHGTDTGFGGLRLQRTAEKFFQTLAPPATLWSPASQPMMLSVSLRLTDSLLVTAASRISCNASQSHRRRGGEERSEGLDGHHLRPWNQLCLKAPFFGPFG